MVSVKVSTKRTVPPRPPTVSEPNPCAPGNAGHASSDEVAPNIAKKATKQKWNLFKDICDLLVQSEMRKDKPMSECPIGLMTHE